MTTDRELAVMRLANIAQKYGLPFRHACKLENKADILYYEGNSDPIKIENAVMHLYDKVLRTHPDFAEQLPEFEYICPQYAAALETIDSKLYPYQIDGFTDGCELTEKGQKLCSKKVDVGGIAGIGLSIFVNKGKYLKKMFEKYDITTKRRSKLGALFGSLVMIGAGAFGASITKDVHAEDSHKDMGRTSLNTIPNTEDVSADGFVKWNADSSKLLCSDGMGNAYLINKDGSGKSELTNVTVADWEPDGIQIVLGKGIYPSGNNELYIADKDGTNQKKIYTMTEKGVLESISWGPKIAFSLNGGIYLINKDGSGLEKILQTSSEIDAGRGYPMWSRDGNEIVYLDNEKIFIYDVSTKSSKEICNSAIWPASWSPDGKKIAFTDYVDKVRGYDVFIINKNGTGRECIVDFTDDQIAEDWSKSGLLAVIDYNSVDKLTYTDSLQVTPQPPVQSWTQAELNEIKKYFPTRILDSQERYELAEMRGDDSDISNNHENYDKNPAQFLVNGKQPVYATIIDYSDKKVFVYGFYRTFNKFYGFDDHEHDAEYAFVEVNKATGKPVKLALTWHLFPPRIYPVSDTKDLEYYVEKGGGGGGKNSWEVITDGKGEHVIANDAVFLPLIKQLTPNATQDLEQTGPNKDKYKTNELSAIRVAGMNLDNRVLDPERYVFGASQTGKAGWMRFELGSPADISVELNGKIISKDKMDIPNAGYENKDIVILGVNANDTPKIKLVGTGNGNIHLKGFLADGKSYMFNVTAPISAGKVYEIQPNWQAILKNQKDSLTIKIDGNGDGQIDKVIKTGTNVVPSDIPTIESVHPLADNWQLPAVVAAGFGLAAGGIYLGRRYFKGSDKPAYIKSKSRKKHHRKPRIAESHSKKSKQMNHAQIMEDLFGED